MALLASMVRTAALAAVALFAAAPAADAHTELVSSAPLDSTALTSPPTSISLTFNEPVNAEFVKLVVDVDRSGDRELAVTQGTRTDTVVGEIPVDLVEGGGSSWQVAYRVTSVDGHPVTGSLRFTVAEDQQESAAESPADSSPTGSSPLDQATRDPRDHAAAPQPGNDPTSARDWLVMIAVVAFLGLPVVVLMVLTGRHRARSRPGLDR